MKPDTGWMVPHHLDSGWLSWWLMISVRPDHLYCSHTHTQENVFTMVFNWAVQQFGWSLFILRPSAGLLKVFTLFRDSAGSSERGVSVWVWGTPSEPPIDHLDQVCVGVLTSDDQQEPETDAEESINQLKHIYYYRLIHPAVQLVCRELLMMVQTSCNVNKRPLDVRGRSVRTWRGSSVTDGGRSHPICCHGAGPTDRPGSSRRKSSVADGFCRTVNDDKQHDVMKTKTCIYSFNFY